MNKKKYNQKGGLEVEGFKIELICPDDINNAVIPTTPEEWAKLTNRDFVLAFLKNIQINGEIIKTKSILKTPDNVIVLYANPNPVVEELKKKYGPQQVSNLYSNLLNQQNYNDIYQLIYIFKDEEETKIKTEEAKLKAEEQAKKDAEIKAEQAKIKAVEQAKKDVEINKIIIDKTVWGKQKNFTEPNPGIDAIILNIINNWNKKGNVKEFNTSDILNKIKTKSADLPKKSLTIRELRPQINKIFTDIIRTDFKIPIKLIDDEVINNFVNNVITKLSENQVYWKQDEKKGGGKQTSKKKSSIKRNSKKKTSKKVSLKRTSKKKPSKKRNSKRTK